MNNVVQYYKKNNIFGNLPCNKPRKPTLTANKQLVSLSKSYHFLTSNEIVAHMEKYRDAKVSTQAAHIRLQEFFFNEHIAT